MNLKLLLIKISSLISGVHVASRYTDAKAKYKGLVPEETIDLLADADPSGNHKYLDWMCKRSVDENLDQVIKAVSMFEEYVLKSKDMPKDINQYKTAEDVFKSIDVITKRNLNSLSLHPGSRLIYPKSVDIPTRWAALSVPNHEAMRFYGSGTRWCVAQETPGHYNSYTARGTFVMLFDLLNRSDKYAVYLQDTKRPEVWEPSDVEIGHSYLSDIAGIEYKALFRAMSAERVGSKSKMELYFKERDNVGAMTFEEAKDYIQGDYKNVDLLPRHYVEKMFAIRDEFAEYTRREIVSKCSPEFLKRHFTEIKKEEMDVASRRLPLGMLVDLYKLGRYDVDVVCISRLPGKMSAVYILNMWNSSRPAESWVNLEIVKIFDKNTPKSWSLVNHGVVTKIFSDIRVYEAISDEGKKILTDSYNKYLTENSSVEDSVKCWYVFMNFNNLTDEDRSGILKNIGAEEFINTYKNFSVQNLDISENVKEFFLDATNALEDREIRKLILEKCGNIFPEQFSKIMLSYYDSMTSQEWSSINWKYVDPNDAITPIAYAIQSNTFGFDIPEGYFNFDQLMKLFGTIGLENGHKPGFSDVVNKTIKSLSPDEFKELIDIFPKRAQKVNLLRTGIRSCPDGAITELLRMLSGNDVEKDIARTTLTNFSFDLDIGPDGMRPDPKIIEAIKPFRSSYKIFKDLCEIYPNDAELEEMLLLAARGNDEAKIIKFNKAFIRKPKAEIIKFIKSHFSQFESMESYTSRLLDPDEWKKIKTEHYDKLISGKKALGPITGKEAPEELVQYMNHENAEVRLYVARKIDRELLIDMVGDSDSRVRLLCAKRGNRQTAEALLNDSVPNVAARARQTISEIEVMEMFGE